MSTTNPCTDSTASGDQIALTVVTSLAPSILSKAFFLNGDGTLRKKTGGPLCEGKSQTVRVADMTEFAALLQRLKANQALMHGVFAHESATVLSKDRFTRHNGEGPTVTRTRNWVSWPAGPAILMIDHDLPADAEALTDNELRERLYEVAPALRGAAAVTRPSASSCIVRKSDGAELRGERGRRVYIGVTDGRDIERAAKVLQAQLWLNGHGFFAVSKSGALLERTLIDGTVYQPEARFRRRRGVRRGFGAAPS